MNKQLKRTTLAGDPAWLWVAPNGTHFYLMQTLGGRSWVARRSANAISTPAFNTREALLAEIQRYFV
jgi:hypothetical protein